MPERLRLALLATIVAAYTVLGVAYAIKTPIWETPDEPAHFNYVRHLAENLRLPELEVGDYNQAYLEELKASKFPPGRSIDSVRYESWQPPLYYLLSAPLFRAGGALPQSQQVVVLRLFSVFLGGILLLVSYRIARRIFPKDNLLALAIPGFIATLPQHIAMTASVSNDTLAELSISLILLVLVKRICDPSPPPVAATEGRPLRRQANPNYFTSRYREGEGMSSWLRRQAWGSAAALGVLLGVALLTKSTIYVAAVLIPLGLVLKEYRLNSKLPMGKAIRSLRILSVMRESAIAYAIALALSGWWFVRNAWVYGGFDLFAWGRHDLVVQGQPLTGVFNLAYAKFFALTTFKSFWAQFGWMGVLADDRTYFLLGILAALAVAGLGLFLLRVIWHPSEEGSLSPTQWLSLLLMGATFALVLGVLVFYNFRFIQAQGRYLFPALIPIAFFVTLGLREIVAPRHAYLFFALLYLALLALDYVCLTRFILPQLG